MCNYTFPVDVSLKNDERREHRVAGGLDETSSWKDLLSRLNRAQLSQPGQLLRGRRSRGTALPFALLHICVLNVVCVIKNLKLLSILVPKISLSTVFVTDVHVHRRGMGYSSSWILSIVVVPRECKDKYCSKVKLAVLKNFIIFGEKYVPQSVCLLAGWGA